MDIQSCLAENFEKILIFLLSTKNFEPKTIQFHPCRRTSVHCCSSDTALLFLLVRRPVLPSLLVRHPVLLPLLVSPIFRYDKHLSDARAEIISYQSQLYSEKDSHVRDVDDDACIANDNVVLDPATRMPKGTGYKRIKSASERKKPRKQNNKIKASHGHATKLSHERSIIEQPLSNLLQIQMPGPNIFEVPFYQNPEILSTGALSQSSARHFVRDEDGAKK